ncbi:MAG: hypothetical protein Q7Q71_10090 [Verrucomicrobiota bacterium JB023]|nr:hypothetical protein [Verrucomicrobiota bacterium JB023]
MRGLHLSLIYLLLFSLQSIRGQAWKGEIDSDLTKLENLARKGDPEAMASYAFHSMRCLGGLTYQPNRIFDLFTRAAAAGSTEGKVGLAHCYCFNVGTVRDLRKAQELIEGPLKEGHPVAQKIRGFLAYGYQDVLPRNLEEVRAFNRKAAAQGCVAARYNLAIRAIQSEDESEIKNGMEQLRRMHENQSFAMASGYLLKALDEHTIWNDHDEVRASCVKRISHYADLNEPYALYRLAIFHEQAGDLENAVACYARSAHLGYAGSWYALWSLGKYGYADDYGNVWVRSRDLGNLAMRAYERGQHSKSSLSWAAWEITRRANQPGYQEKLPQLEKDLLAGLKEGACQNHDVLGRLYYRANAKKNPKLARPAWARAHLEAHSHHNTDGLHELAFRFLEGRKETEKLARGYACVVQARNMNDSYWLTEKNWQWALGRMTPKALERGKELVADRYPHGEKHRRKAEDFLIKIGHLPKRVE